MNSGSDINNAIVLENCGSDSTGSRAIYDILNQKFGSKDGSWFVINENDLQNKKLKKTFRVVFVELANGSKVSLWFDITDWKSVK